MMSDILANLIENVKGQRERHGRRGETAKKVAMMEIHRSIGGYHTQMLWRLDEVGIASRIERIEMKQGHRGE
jgi:hypothetical protein